MLLYCHIPYCDSKCHYCSFNSYVGRFESRTRYMEALLEQLPAELERFGASPGSITSLFIGGGTPSTVPAELYTPLFEALAPWLADDAEISSEANPNSASESWLAGMRQLGVNRLSFGVQSFDDEKLRRLGRAHSSAQAIEAIERAAEIGFERLSLDLIYNCAGDDRALLEADLRQALSLPVGHLSAYELTIEEGTPFARTPEVRQENDSLARWMARHVEETGLVQYEISNFGDPCRHNLGYWRHEDYIGLGAGAVGFLRDRRFYPHSDLDVYLDNPLARRIEPLDAEALKTERIFLGLRSRVGIEATLLNSGERERAEILLSEGKLRQEGARYFCTDYFLADGIALFLMD
ncbi:radical SAM family heme chaperone HemW [Nitratifractor sp.]